MFVTAERQKMQSQLEAQYMPFFWLIALTFCDKKYRISTHCDKKYCILTISNKTELYSTVLQQDNVVFNSFATKQCWGMLTAMWGQPLSCSQPPKCTTATYASVGYRLSLSLSGSLCSLALFGFLWLAVWLPLAPSGSLWLALARSLAHSLAPPGSLLLTLALLGSLWLSLARRICLKSPCLAHKALLRYLTFCRSVVDVIISAR